MDGSDTSSESDQEMLVEIEARKHLEATSKKQSCNILLGFILVLKAAACWRAYLKVSNNAKHSTDKKAETF